MPTARRLAHRTHRFERADEIGLGFGRPAVGAMALRGDGCEGEAGAGEERGG